MHVWCVEKAFNLTWESWREIDYMYSDLCKLTQLLERCVYRHTIDMVTYSDQFFFQIGTVINYRLLLGMFF